MTTLDDHQVVFEFGVREATMSISSIPSFDQSMDYVPSRKNTKNNQSTTMPTPNSPKTAHHRYKKSVKGSSSSYVKQIAITIDAERCVSQILFDRILDSRSNEKRLDIKQLVEPWLKYAQQHASTNETAPMKSKLGKVPAFEYNDYKVSTNSDIQSQPKCIDLIANLKHFKFISWLNEKSVCIYTLESATAHLSIPRDWQYFGSIQAGKEVHKLDFIVYKAPQPTRRMTKDIQNSRNQHVASINTQTFPSVLARIMTKKESHTAPRNSSRSPNQRLYDKYNSFDMRSVADEDELFEKSEKITVSATIGFSKMNASVTEKMFGTLVRLYTQLRKETVTAIKVYQEVASSVAKIKYNIDGKQYSAEQTIMTKSMLFPQMLFQIKLRFEGLNAKISLSDSPNISAAAKSGSLNVDIVYLPEYLPVRSDKLSLKLKSADCISFEVLDEMKEDEEARSTFHLFDDNKEEVDLYDPDSDSESSSSHPFSIDHTENNDDEIDGDVNNDGSKDGSGPKAPKPQRQQSKPSMLSGTNATRIVINDNEIYKGGKKKRKEQINVELQSNKGCSNIRKISPLHSKTNIKIMANISRVNNQWQVIQDLKLKKTQIQFTPAVVSLVQRLAVKYNEEFKNTLSANDRLLKEMNGFKRMLIARLPNIASHPDEMDHDASTAVSGSHIEISKNSGASIESSQMIHYHEKSHNLDPNDLLDLKVDQLSLPKSQTGPVSVNSKSNFTQRAKRYQQEMVETEATDMTHIYFVSMISVENFLCLGVLGHNSVDRPLLSTSIKKKKRGKQQNENEYGTFLSLYCQEARCGLKSSDLYDERLMKLTMDSLSTNVVLGLDEKMNLGQLWKVARYHDFENLFANKWRFIEFNARHEFKYKWKRNGGSFKVMNRSNSHTGSKLMIKSSIMVADVASTVHPNVLQLVMDISETYPSHHHAAKNNDTYAFHIADLIDHNESIDAYSVNAVDEKVSPDFDIDLNFEWRGGKLEMIAPSRGKSSKPNSILSLPYIKLHSSIFFNDTRMESDSFFLTKFDKISLNMHFLQFIGAVIKRMDAASELHSFNKVTQYAHSPVLYDDEPAQAIRRIVNHTLCVSIANLNTTLSCQPIYDKLECVFTVNPIAICWNQASLDKPESNDNIYTDSLTISIPKVSMRIYQRKHLMSDLRFDLDIQRSKGFNLRADGLPIVTTLICLEKVIIQTSALGIIATNLLIQCIENQLTKVQMSRTKSSNSSPQSPEDETGDTKANNPAINVLFCIKDQIRLIIDCTELPLINTQIKAALNQFTLQYQDDGRANDGNNADHMIRCKVSFRGLIEFSDKKGSKKQQQQYSPSSMLATIMNIKYDQNEPGSSWKKKHERLIKKLDPLEGSVRMNDIMTISFVHHLKQNGDESDYSANPFDVTKSAVNRFQIKIPASNTILKTETLRRIIEVNTTSPFYFEIEDSPSNADDNFMVNILLELEDSIVLRLASHTAPYFLSAFYIISEFAKREQNDIIAHLRQKSSSSSDHMIGHKKDKSNDNDHEPIPPIHSPVNTLTRSSKSLSETMFNRYYNLRRGLSPLSKKGHTLSAEFFGIGSNDNFKSDISSLIIGNFELKARSLGLILYVDEKQKNNYLRMHLNHFRFLFNRKCKDYSVDDHTQIIEDDVDIYVGINPDDENNEYKQQQHSGKSEHGLYVVPVQYILDPNSRSNDNGPTKDLIAVPLCHIHYNAKTNMDDGNVRDIFEAKWGNQTFILPLDLRPFDNIGKTFKKYHRDYQQIRAKHQKQPLANSKKEQKEQNLDSLKTINEKKEQNEQKSQHHQTHTSSFSISSQISHQSNNSLLSKVKQMDKKRTFAHDKYEFEPPFPSVSYIVSAETILQKLGVETPQNTIPETFYASIVEPIADSFRVIRRISQKADNKLSPLLNDHQ